jgi:hypothetical protein
MRDPPSLITVKVAVVFAPTVGADGVIVSAVLTDRCAGRALGATAS